MFYEKKLKTAQEKVAYFRLTNFSGGLNANIDESILPQKYAKMCLNFKTDSGALKSGGGVDKFSVNGTTISFDVSGEKALKLFYFKRYDFENECRDDKILVYTESGKIYSSNLFKENKTFYEVMGFKFTSEPRAINYRLFSDDVIIISSETDGMQIWNGVESPYEVSDAPKISSMCLHYERLFATVDKEKSSVFFSDDLDPTNWSVSLEEAGFIDMPDNRGALLKVVEFLDYVYIFRSYGISRITAYAEQTEFSATQLYVTSGRIFPETVVVCGDRVLFLAENGLYSFNGVSCTKICDGIDPLIEVTDNFNAQGIYFNGKYYLNFLIKYDDTLKKVLLEYNLFDKSFYLMNGLNIVSMEVINSESFSKLVFIVQDDNTNKIAEFSDKGDFFDKSLQKEWITPTTDLGYPEKKKNIKELHIYSNKKGKVIIKSELKTREIKLCGNEKITRYKVNLKGSSFKIIFSSDESGVIIRKPTFKVAIY